MILHEGYEHRRDVRRGHGGSGKGVSVESVHQGPVPSPALELGVCPADKVTKRQETKDLLSLAEIKYPGITERVFGALVRLGIDGWQKGSVKGKNDDT